MDNKKDVEKMEPRKLKAKKETVKGKGILAKLNDDKVAIKKPSKTGTEKEKGILGEMNDDKKAAGK